MKSASALPTIGGIQMITAALTVSVSAGFYIEGASARSIGVVVGGALIMLNLWALAGLGRLLIAASGGASSGKLAVLLAPLKLLVLLALVYLILVRTKVDTVGFAVGVSTQLAAILFETGRAWVKTLPSGQGQLDKGT